MDDSMADTAGPSSPPRARSSRTRVKTQRALDSEHVERLLAKAKAGEPVPELENASSKEKVTKAKAKVPKKTKKGKNKTTYCICQTDGEDGRPMIECEECNDWFHFDCLNLSAEEAEKIHEFVCPSCEESTGRKTSHHFEINTFPSPSPPSDFEIPSKRKAKTKAKLVQPRRSVSVKSSPRSGSPSTSDDDASEADLESASESDSASGASFEMDRPSKKRRSLPSDTKPTVKNESRSSVEATSRQPLADRRAPTTPISKSKGKAVEKLGPVREHVLKQLTGVVKALFGDAMTHVEAVAYTEELEAAMYNSFKDVVKGKSVPGPRYKGQFSLLSRSLNHGLNLDTMTSILDRKLSAAQVANLTPAELASSKRLAELEAAKQASLQSTVRSKDDQPAAIRLGRDGLERAEDAREKEMKALQEAERSARQREIQRRESMLSEHAEGEVQKGDRVDADVPASPVTSVPGSASRPSFTQTATGRPSQSPSVVPPSPVAAGAGLNRLGAGSPRVSMPQRQFSLTSAWGDKGDGEAEEAVGLGIGESDQAQVDLSDIVMEEEEEEEAIPVEQVVESKEEDPMEVFLRSPVVWTGGIVNPAKTSPHVPPLEVRHISTAPRHPLWSVLLPSTPIQIAGRVSTADSLKYLEETRLNPTKELTIVALTLTPTASDDQKRVWNDIAEFHLQKGRHAVAHPHGDLQDQAIPPGGAREIYIIPLRPEDSSPQFTDLIDGYSLPAKRTEVVFLGVFVASKRRSPSPLPPIQAPSVAAIPPPPPQIPPPSSAAEAQEAKARLQALISSLKPGALPIPMSGAGGITPPPVPTGYGNMQPPTGGPSYPPGPPGPPGPGGQYGYPGSGGYQNHNYGFPPERGYPEGGGGGGRPHEDYSRYGGDRGYGPPSGGEWRDDRREQPRDRRDDRGPPADRHDQRGRRDWEPREHDNGWASRRGGGGGGGGGRY